MADKVYWEDLNIGDIFSSGEVLVDREEMLAYNRKYDPWPFHVDDEAAKATPFEGLIASGGYTISLMYQLFHQIANKPEEPWAFLGVFDWDVKFPNPVYPGDRLVASAKVTDKKESSKPWRGISQVLLELSSQEEKVVLSVLSTMMMGRRPTS